MSKISPIYKDVSNYYDSKLRKHGPVPQGVDWNSLESQTTRFQQLSNILPDNEFFSVLDYGCGYGAYYEFLSESYNQFAYYGYDISQEMIDAAKSKFSSDGNLKWSTSVSDKSDFVIASGLFNVRLEYSDEDWYDYIIETLEEMNELSSKGFSFNALTKYSDTDKMREYLYYADPLKLFDYCKRNFSKQVALLHDYPLYEFTILVRK